MGCRFKPVSTKVAVGIGYSPQSLLHKGSGSPSAAFLQRDIERRLQILLAEGLE